jgi:hypothetical protein
MLLVGKTTFLAYLLVKRLQERLSTVFCDNKGYAHVFSEHGFETIHFTSDQYIPELLDNPSCVGLLNLGSRLEVPPEAFHPVLRRGRVIVATSPNPKHVQVYHERGKGMYYMPTWRWDDLYCARRVVRHQLKDSYSTIPPV